MNDKLDPVVETAMLGSALEGLCVGLVTMSSVGRVGAITPVSHLKQGETYLLKRWDNGWHDLAERVAGATPLRFEGLARDGLYWLVRNDSRRLERIFTIENGRQRFW